MVSIIFGGERAGARSSCVVYVGVGNNGDAETQGRVVPIHMWAAGAILFARFFVSLVFNVYYEIVTNRNQGFYERLTKILQNHVGK